LSGNPYTIVQKKKKNSVKIKVKVKQCHYRPGQTLRVPGD